MPDTPASPPKRKALGKGLSALLPGAPSVGDEAGQSVEQIPVKSADPNPVQPRSGFDPESLRELATSIRSDGVLQPILVSRNGDRYTVIVGERRLRACRLAGLTTIPAIVRTIAPDRLLEVTLIENIQRDNLNPIEIALALNRMSNELDLIHEELATRTGMSRASITNHLRLLRLPPSLQDFLLQGSLQMGHARALLALDSREDQETLGEHAARSQLSVREVERMVRKIQKPARKRSERSVDASAVAAVEELQRFLQAPVRLRQRGSKGVLEISFSSDEELSSIYDRIVGAPT